MFHEQTQRGIMRHCRSARDPAADAVSLDIGEARKVAGAHGLGLGEAWPLDSAGPALSTSVRVGLLSVFVLSDNFIFLRKIRNLFIDSGLILAPRL